MCNRCYEMGRNTSKQRGATADEWGKEEMEKKKVTFYKG